MTAKEAVNLLANGPGSDYQRLLYFWRNINQLRRRGNDCANSPVMVQHLRQLFQKTKTAVEKARTIFVAGVNHGTNPEQASEAFLSHVRNEMSLYHKMMLENNEPEGTKPGKKSA